LISSRVQPFYPSIKVGKLGAVAGATVLFAILPLLYVIGYGFDLSLDQWVSLWSARIPELLWNTLSLALLVALLSVFLGVPTAWIIARMNFPGRTVAIWLMLLPLTIPTYVFAHIYTILMDDDGWLGLAWHWIFGEASPIPDISHVFGVASILTLAGFSYIFLLVRASLSHSTKDLEEAARIQGASTSVVFYLINLPLMRPAIAAGLAVIVLHVLSDFGAVSMLRYQTFTLSIYTQMSGRMDYNAAAGLSFILILLSLTFLVLERFFRRRQRFYTGAQTKFVQRRETSIKERVFIWLWLGSISLFSFILPLIWMLDWSLAAWRDDLINADFWSYCLNSGVISFVTASLVLVIAFPIAFYHTRRHSRLSQTYLHLSSVGFALPGPVIALGVLAFVLAQLPIVYGTFAALLIAMIIRFLPLAIQSQEAALQQLTPSVEEAGRVLGAGPIENLRRVVLPIVRGGMASAWVLVFIDTLKELPATLILRPTGFDTLPIRIWIEASEEMLELAAPAALMLVIGTLPAIWIMRKSEKYQ